MFVFRKELFLLLLGYICSMPKALSLGGWVVSKSLLLNSCKMNSSRLFLSSGGKTDKADQADLWEKYDISKDESSFSSFSSSNFSTLNDTVAFNGKYRKIIERKVRFPQEQIVSFEILTQGCSSVVVFVWDKKTSTTTLIREYHAGVQKVLYGVVAGMYEPVKHASALECAQFELEEEAQLRTNAWVSLLANQSIAMSFDKYSDNKFHPFLGDLKTSKEYLQDYVLYHPLLCIIHHLALDCEVVENPREMDAEEYIVVERNVSYEKVMNLIMTGQMNVVSTYAVLLGIRKLEEMGIKLS